MQCRHLGHRPHTLASRPQLVHDRPETANDLSAPPAPRRSSESPLPPARGRSEQLPKLVGSRKPLWDVGGTSNRLSSALQTVRDTDCQDHCVTDEPRGDQRWLDDDGRWIAPNAQPTPSSISDDPWADVAGARSPDAGADRSRGVAPDPPTGEQRSRPRVVITLVVALVAVVWVGVIVAVTSTDRPHAAATSITDPVDSITADEVATPSPVQVVGHQVDETHAVYVWTSPDSLPTDTFQWRTSDGRQMGKTSLRR